MLKKDLSNIFPAEVMSLSLEQMKADLAQTKISLTYLFDIIDEFDEEYTNI